MARPKARLMEKRPVERGESNESRNQEAEEDDKGRESAKRKKTRRSKPIQNQLKAFNLFYMNIRDLKSKFASLQMIIAEVKPAVFALVETWLEDSDEIEVEGYHIFRNDRNNEGGGVLIGVKKCLSNVAVEVGKTKEVYESLWVVIDNGQVKIKVGAVYLPQENETNMEEMGEIYKMMKEEIQEGQKKDQTIILTGDFNCKIGNKELKGNKAEVTKGGRKLMNLVETENLTIANVSQKCSGLWTRVENGKQSVLDYIIIEKGDDEFVQEVIIDEEKEYAPSHLVKENGVVRKVFSDHNAMMMKTNLIMKELVKVEEGSRVVMTKEGYEAFKKEVQEEKISSIWDQKKNTQEKYTEWSNKVLTIKQKHEKIQKPKKNQRSRVTRLLIKEKKMLKEDKKSSGNREKKGIIKAQIKDIQLKIIEEQQSTRFRQMMKIGSQICKEGKIDSGGFWKLQKRLKRKFESAHSVLNLDGEKVETEEDIKEVYQNFYEKLLSETNKKVEESPENEKMAETIKKFEEIMEAGKGQKERQVTTEDVLKATKRLKKGKAKDRQCWNNEMILEAGEEMTISVTKMVNEILRNEEIPIEWLLMLIISIHKKGKKEVMGNKRGLFLTNVVSKLFEKIMDDIVGEVEYDELQHGGKKGRAPLDIWIIMLAIRDTNIRLKKNTYLFFADLVKCFDRLWLKDCLVDLHEAGVREKEIRILHKMNSEAHIIVKTPVGPTHEFKLGEMVKQGTVFGPKLCCVSTGKINKIGRKAKTVLSPNISIGAVTFVDDIGAIGSPDTVETVGKNCSAMEEEKGMEFSLPKTNWMCVKTGKEPKKDIKIEVKQGKIKEAVEYKHLGNWWNEKGNFDRQITHMEKKANDMIRECNIFCSKEKIGKMEFQGKLFVYENLIIHSLFYNIEAWSNLRKSDKEILEVIQGKVLKGIFGLPKSTPYWGKYCLNLVFSQLTF